MKTLDNLKAFSLKKKQMKKVGGGSYCTDLITNYRSARNSFGYDASSLLSLKYQSLSITKFYCKRILLIIQKKQLGMSMLLLII